MNNPKSGEIWQHRKHDPDGIENNFTYEIIGIGRHTENEDDSGILVIYKPLYSGKSYLDEVSADYYVRPLEMFLEVDEKGQRFKKIA